MNLQGQLAQALDHHRAGRLEQAEALYSAILVAAPDHADALHLAGVAAHQRGNHEQAIDRIKRAIALRQAVADYHNNLGEAYRAVGALSDAKRSYRAALKHDRKHADAHNNLGLVHLAEDKLEAAVVCFQAALAAEACHARAHNNLGIVRKRQGRLDRAIGHYRDALAAAPSYAEAQANLANALWAQGMHDAAFAAYRQALALNPGNPDALVSFGAALSETGALDQAGAMFRQAVEVAPDHVSARYNLAVNLMNTGNVEAAIEQYRAALRLDPDRVDANKNLSVALLLDGQFAEGFERWDWRWREPDVWRRQFDIPVWHGQPLAGKRLLVWGEQGVGDELMLGTVLPDAIEAAASVTVECDSRLVPLFGPAMPDAEFVARSDPPSPQLFDPAPDFAVPLGDLCRWLRQTPDRFAEPTAYLTADPGLVAQAEARLGRSADKARIGISWRSKPRRANAENLAFKAGKSSPPEAWGPVLRRAEVRFVNLQYGDCRDELAAVKNLFGCDIFHDDAVDQFDSLAEFAAQIATLDLIISTSNTTVHLAGALGKPVWTLIPAVPDWRWQRDRDDSLWYPNMRLFRQTAPGDWDSVFTAVGAALDDWLGR